MIYIVCRWLLFPVSQTTRRIFHSIQLTYTRFNTSNSIHMQINTKWYPNTKNTHAHTQLNFILGSLRMGRLNITFSYSCSFNALYTIYTTTENWCRKIHNVSSNQTKNTKPFAYIYCVFSFKVPVSMVLFHFWFFFLSFCSIAACLVRHCVKYKLNCAQGCNNHHFSAICKKKTPNGKMC